MKCIVNVSLDSRTWRARCAVFYIMSLAQSQWPEGGANAEWSWCSHKEPSCHSAALKTRLSPRHLFMPQAFAFRRAPSPLCPCIYFPDLSDTPSSSLPLMLNGLYTSWFGPSIILCLLTAWCKKQKPSFSMLLFLILPLCTHWQEISFKAVGNHDT